MNKKIALLRGINVGGKRIILMPELKLLCENLGWEQVETFIQSGNIIFNSNQDIFELEKCLEIAIMGKYGFDVPVIIRSSSELQDAIDRNPFFDGNADIDGLALTFLKNKSTKENEEKTKSYNYEPDKFIIVGKNVFLRIQGNYHLTKYTNNFFEKKLNTEATTRNWKTVLKLFELTKL
ncbi:MAG: hypothetical protein A2X64_03380 [Ignavibacteria bacterium GWF2_33_9]|nr:MAG: hypothetical protein A2X64_03380 [Ignavibacteria bacterium GWF2_33_9]